MAIIHSMNVTKCNKLLRYVNAQLVITAIICLFILSNEAVASSCVEVKVSSHLSKDIQRKFTDMAHRVWQYCPEPLKTNQKNVVQLIDFKEEHVEQSFVFQSPYQLSHSRMSLKLKVEKWQESDLLWKRVLLLQSQGNEMSQPVLLARQGIFEQFFQLKQGLSQPYNKRVNLKEQLYLKGLQRLYFESKKLQNQVLNEYHLKYLEEQIN